MFHLVEWWTLRSVKVSCRNLAWMLTWRSVPLRRSQTPSWKSIEHWTQQTKTLHRLLKAIPFESEAVTKATELNIKDKRVFTEMYESEADARIISGKWVLKPQKARYVLRAFEEDVKGEDVFRKHHDDSGSEDATLSSDRPQKRR